MNQADFDPYREWLGISADEQPPDHYRLLAVRQFESDREAIRKAALARSAEVRKYGLGKQSQVATRVLGELASAMACLTDDARKTAYDEQLRRGLRPVPVQEPVPRPAAPVPVSAATPRPTPAPLAAAVAAPAPSRAVGPVGKVGVSIRGRRTSRQRGWWSSLVAWLPLALAAGAAVAVLLGMVFLLRGRVTKSDGDDLSAGNDKMETQKRASDGFTPLFNGKDLTGWKRHPSRQGRWRVENGVLIGSGPAASDLFSERGNFTNVHLRAEVRVNDGGNSGVFARSAFILAGLGPGGYEAQINSTHADKNKTGSLYGPGGVVVSTVNSAVRPNEWFNLDLIAIDNHIVVKINGKTTADYFDFARRFPMGHFALQQHNPQTVVEFRKIEIRELSSAAASDGWTSLFNGRDLSGWKAVGFPGWSVQKGALVGRPNPGQGWLMSDRDFGDFELELDYKLEPRGNSGVFLRASADGAVSDKDFHEVQLLDDLAPEFASVVASKKNGAIFGQIEPAMHIASLAGSWNRLRVVVRGMHVQVSVNGVQVVDGELFRGKPKTGRLGLQLSEQRVAFRNIRVREISRAAVDGKNVGLVAPAAHARPGIVPPDAQEYGGHWYKFYQERISWRGARDRCKSYRGHLAVIDSKSENDFVGGLVAKAAWQDAWIGATDEAEEGKWRSADGELLHFTNWFTNQPNNKNSEEHYVLISNRSVGGNSIGWRWSDQPNESTQHQPGFVCEWEPKTASSPTALATPRGSDTLVAPNAVTPAPGIPTNPTRDAPVGGAAASAFSAGSVWKGKRTYRNGAFSPHGVSYELHVRERDGVKFKGHVFDSGPNRNRAEVEGEVEGSALVWRERSIYHSGVMTMRGTLADGVIRVTFKGRYPSGATNDGDGELTLSGSNTAE